MNWLELSVETPPEFVEPVSELFRRYGDSDVVVQLEGDWDPDNDPHEPGPPTKVTVTSYLKMDATTYSRKEMIDVGIRLISHIQPLGKLQQKVIEEQDWEIAWKGHFSVMRVGRRMVLKPTWQEYAPRPNDIVVELDPGMAFGTGHHPTTRMCLEELERHVTPGMRVLDVGCGSGILSIATAKLGAGQVVGIDIEDVAVHATQKNAAQNGVAERIIAYGGSLPSPKAPPASFDLVVANITAMTIASLARHMAEALKPGGLLIASGIIMERLEEAEEGLAPHLEIVERRYDGDWVLLKARKG